MDKRYDPVKMKRLKDMYGDNWIHHYHLPNPYRDITEGKIVETEKNRYTEEELDAIDCEISYNKLRR